MLQLTPNVFTGNLSSANVENSTIRTYGQLSLIAELINSAYVGVGRFAFIRILVCKDTTIYPFIIDSLIETTFLATVRTTCNIGLTILGQRERIDNENRPCLNFLRKYSWKIITGAENLYHRIDTIISRILGIRTIRVIQARKIEVRDLSHFEIFRHAINESISTSAHSAVFTVGHLLSFAAVESMGFSYGGAKKYCMAFTKYQFVAIPVMCLFFSLFEAYVLTKNAEPETAPQAL